MGQVRARQVRESTESRLVVHAGAGRAGPGQVLLGTGADEDRYRSGQVRFGTGTDRQHCPVHAGARLCRDRYSLGQVRARQVRENTEQVASARYADALFKFVGLTHPTCPAAAGLARSCPSGPARRPIEADACVLQDNRVVTEPPAHRKQYRVWLRSAIHGSRRAQQMAQNLSIQV